MKNDYSESTEYFSCYRKNTLPVLAADMTNAANIFDVCNDQRLMKQTENGMLVLTAGRYRMTLTALMKATSNSPIMIEIARLRGGLTESLGVSGIMIEAAQGEPELGLSTSLDMLEDLLEGDLIQIKQTEAGGGSFLRSSDWRLLRLEGHRTDQTGLLCEILGPAGGLQCNAGPGPGLAPVEDNAIRITKAGLYELTLNGLIFQVSFQKS